MGTNYYYFEKPACECCKRDFEARHIGKSSGGWCFGLHVYPEDGIVALHDWRALFSKPGSWIKNEYGERIPAEAMLDIITHRDGGNIWTRAPGGYRSWDDFHLCNYSEPGPHGLLRHRVTPGHCIGHGSGTWDLLVGDFS